MQIVIPDLPHLRLSAEKELSKDRSPRLIEIYEDVLNRAGISDVPAQKLCDIEWEIDQAVMIARDAVVTILREAVSMGKDVVITSDCYYDRAKIEEILDRLKITGYKKLFVSCEYKTLKTQKLFDELIDQYPGKKILHIGDDEKADIESAALHGIDTFRLYGGIQLYDALGGLGIEERTVTLADRVKVGLFIAKIFNDPFVFDDPDRRVSIKDAEDIGYLFCAPMITDFVQWMQIRTKEDDIGQILLGARDGYLLQKLYELAKINGRSFYFHTSRTAAIRAGMQSPEDIDYVESMKFFGTAKEAVKVRFGIDISDQSKDLVDELILKKADKQKENYRKYIERLEIEKTDVAFFDFVAKGTTQMYLQRLFSQHMKGYYFLQLEPEFMADKGLDIEPFYSNEERDTSAIFDNYYILETVLTAPDPQMLEMDDNGEPVFAKETRSAKDLAVFERAQRGIIEYFKDYLAILPKEARCNNKAIDERFLSLINKVSILDEDFLSIKVEDPFFGRMTDIRDVIG